MEYFRKEISETLAKKLKDYGMPITYSRHLHQIAPNVKGLIQANFEEIDCPTYAEVFEWLMTKKEIFITLPPIGCLDDGSYRFEATIAYAGGTYEEYLGGYAWHEAADAAIEKALTIN